MKKIIIISPHFPPSNLAAVHRTRLFAKHLPEFGWEPIIITVDESYYEEEKDFKLMALLSKNMRVEKVKAFPLTSPRVIGDIGLRGFIQIYKKARNIIKQEIIDFLYIPIPSFYCALLGRLLHKKTGIPYGIDYIDPWVHQFPGSDTIFSRHWFSTAVAKFLEPIAVKKAALITGVAEGYYKGVQERNPNLIDSAVFGAMPYGGEETDHTAVNSLNLQPYLFAKHPDKIQLVYAGAMLPKAYEFLDAIFQSISNFRHLFVDVEFHFIGTGKYPNDPHSYNIKPYAEKYGLWENIIFEYARRIPYLDVLVHLNAATGIFILGSTEPHYTPSKVSQGILSEKPILAILHAESTAVGVLERSKAGLVLKYDERTGIENIKTNFSIIFKHFENFIKEFKSTNVDRTEFDQYSAKNISMKLSQLIDQCLRNNIN